MAGKDGTKEPFWSKGGPKRIWRWSSDLRPYKHSVQANGYDMGVVNVEVHSGGQYMGEQLTPDEARALADALLYGAQVAEEQLAEKEAENATT